MVYIMVSPGSDPHHSGSMDARKYSQCILIFSSLLAQSENIGKVEKYWIGSYRQGQAGPGRGRRLGLRPRRPKVKNIGKVKKKWIGSYRHKAGPGWGRPGQTAGVRQGRAWPGPARPLGCCPGGWKVKKGLEK